MSDGRPFRYCLTINTFFLILSAEALSPKLIVQQGQGGDNLTCFFIEANQSLGPPTLEILITPWQIRCQRPEVFAFVCRDSSELLVVNIEHSKRAKIRALGNSACHPDRHAVTEAVQPAIASELQAPVSVYVTFRHHQRLREALCRLKMEVTTRTYLMKLPQQREHRGRKATKLIYSMTVLPALHPPNHSNPHNQFLVIQTSKVAH